MPTVKLYNVEGKEVGTKQLPERIFGVRVEPSLVEQAVVVQRANARAAIAHTKTRGEVRGGGKKPWRQKGTGRARQGSIRSPQWKGGGVVFGPRKDRNFSLKMNQKARQKALFMALSDKVAAQQLVLLDVLQLPQMKTKQFAMMLRKLPVKHTVLVVLEKRDDGLVRASRNIPGVTPIQGNSLNVVDVLNHQTVLLPQQAIETIAATFRTGAKES